MRHSAAFIIEILLIAIAMMGISLFSAEARDLRPGYIGIFKDATHDTSPVSGGGYNICPAQYEQFECWIWCLPSWEGMQAALFAVRFPSDAIFLGAVQNPEIRLSLGTVLEGVEIVLNEGVCQMDWFWTHKVTGFWLAPLGTPAKIEVIPHPELHELGYCICEGEPFAVPFTVLTPLYICWTPEPGPLGVEEASWGAIKSMF